MKTKKSKSDIPVQEEESNAQILEVSDVSPHSKAIYEAGKMLLTESINIGREFCKFMITTSVGAIPIYIGILTFLLPKDYQLGLLRSVLSVLPAVIFLVATTVFAVGYLPVTSQFSLDIIEEIERERSKAIRRRRILIGIGFSLFVIGILASIVIVAINLNSR